MSENLATQDYMRVDIDNFNVDPQVSACLRLWAAKLITHIKDYTDAAAWEKHVKGSRFTLANEPLHRASSRIWFESPHTGPGTFIWVCELFNLDPQRAYKQIQKIARESKKLPQRYPTKGASDE